MTAQGKPSIGVVVPDGVPQRRVGDRIASLRANDVEIVAFAGNRTSVREVAKSFSRVDVYPTPGEMLDDKECISGVVIVGPLEHQASIALEHRCHVLCNPPSAMTRIAAAEMVAEAAKRGLVVAFGYPRALQLAPVIEGVRDRGFGPITGASFDWPEDAIPADPRFWTGVLGREAVGEAVAAILPFFDCEPRCVRASTNVGDETTEIQIQFENDHRVKIVVGWAPHGPARLVLSGEEGSLEAPVVLNRAVTPMAEPSAFEVIHTGPEGEVWPRTLTHAEAMANQVRDWVRAIVGKEKLVPPTQPALHVKSVAIAAGESASLVPLGSLGPFVSVGGATALGGRTAAR